MAGKPRNIHKAAQNIARLCKCPIHWADHGNKVVLAKNFTVTGGLPEEHAKQPNNANVYSYEVKGQQRTAVEYRTNDGNKGAILLPYESDVALDAGRITTTGILVNPDGSAIPDQKGKDERMIELRTKTEENPEVLGKSVRGEALDPIYGTLVNLFHTGPSRIERDLHGELQYGPYLLPPQVKASEFRSFGLFEDDVNKDYEKAGLAGKPFKNPTKFNIQTINVHTDNGIDTLGGVGDGFEVMRHKVHMIDLKKMRNRHDIRKAHVYVDADGNQHILVGTNDRRWFELRHDPGETIPGWD